MEPSFDELLARYDYAFPPELIAQEPADPRDSSRLLVHDRKTGNTSWAQVKDIGDFLPQNALLVLNDTKVIPARLPAKRQSGGMVELLILGTEKGCLKALAKKKLKPGETLTLDDRTSLVVEEDCEKQWLLRPSFDIAELPLVLDRLGVMPLPPYIKHSPLSREELKDKYQSVFAKHAGSIAAPTASLHFTKALLEGLKAKGVETTTVRLHVHLGTFAPLTEAQWKEGRLHTEEYAIDDESMKAMEKAKAEGRPVIAVGTTALRTLESAADERGKIVRPSGTTDLFIKEGYDFRLTDGLLTNFHVPKSSLLMLVSAFAGRDTVMELYKEAIEKKFRLFSFGDAMLLI